ncbi:MAG TPA: GTPase HflX [Oligoflexia bacterium]|nr:GTPase HflX [Oligoflexia bacterium]HMR23898.1 GTPase HflX [Oligoflexia bacterium]
MKTLPILGHSEHLKSHYKKELQKILRYKFKRQDLIAKPTLNALSNIALSLNIHIAAIQSRSGEIIAVSIGNAKDVNFPDLQRFRQGLVRLSGMRMFIVSPFSNLLSQQNINNLLIKRLDYVCKIQVSSHKKNPDYSFCNLSYLHPNPKYTQATLSLEPFDINDHFDAYQFSIDLEKEIISNTAAAEDLRPDNQAIICAIKTSKNLFFEQDYAELLELCKTAGLNVVDQALQRKDTPDVKTFFGQGKLLSIAEDALFKEVDYLVFLQDLSPTQLSNIGKLTDLKVIDRTQLILDIFAKRAQSHDGKLQVELAQLKYMLPRLRERETHLSRLTGGIGGRGPGETKLEVHTRKARDKINNLEKKLKQLEKKRFEKRKSRIRNQVPIVSILGYTNAGKSTLLNTLTQAKAMAENKLFATLDPFSKRLRFPQEREVILTDTVGFIRNLPKDLMQAFKATLEEIQDAQLLLHVIDVSNPAFHDHIEIVDQILTELDCQNIKKILVFNKIDLLEAEHAQEICQQYNAIGISALNKESCRPLIDAISSFFSIDVQTYQ